MRWFGRPAGHRRWKVNVAALADGELPEAEVARFAAHLETCEPCREALAGERALKRMLPSALPGAPAPRSFAITPAMLAAPPKEPVRERTPMLAMRFAQVTAGIAVLGLVSLLVVDMSGSGQQGDGAAAPMAAMDNAADGAAESVGLTAAENTATAGPGSLPPYDGGGVSGQGAESPVAEPTPEPPAAKSANDGASPPGDDASVAGESDRDGGVLPAEQGKERDWLLAAQIALAVAAAGSLAAYLAIRRTVRRTGK